MLEDGRGVQLMSWRTEVVESRAELGPDARNLPGCGPLPVVGCGGVRVDFNGVASPHTAGN
jgi:hypothetical protein